MAHSKKPSSPISDARFLVVGLGISGYWTARWLAEEGADVMVTDVKDPSMLNPEFLQDLKALNVTLETGKHSQETFFKADTIVLSPGVPTDTPLIRAAIQRQISVLGELELASMHTDAPIVAITGTNGKTTVTTFLGQALRHAGFDVFVGGNIGTPLTAYLAERKKADFLVLEVSSFQLDTIDRFCPDVSIILNISPDHLDRYEDYDAYIRSKLRIYMNQGPGQTAILNNDDPVLSSVVPPKGVSVLRYGLERKPGIHAFIEKKVVQKAVAGANFFSLEAFSLSGSHNLENLLAVVLAGLAMGVDNKSLQKTIDEFKGLPNRLERMGADRPSSFNKGVQFYNDSKATNVDAAARAIQSFDEPLVLIAGGRHKGSDYRPLVQACKGRVKSAVFLGEAASLLAKAFTNKIPFSMASNMDDAVKQAFDMAESGMVVLLAPACSSFDMFDDYVHRGQAFKAAVEDILNGK